MVQIGLFAVQYKAELYGCTEPNQSINNMNQIILLLKEISFKVSAKCEKYTVLI